MRRLLHLDEFRSNFRSEHRFGECSTRRIHCSWFLFLFLTSNFFGSEFFVDAQNTLLGPVCAHRSQNWLARATPFFASVTTLPSCARMRNLKNFCASRVLLHVRYYCPTAVLGGLLNFLTENQKSSKLAVYASSESASTRPEYRGISRQGRFFIEESISRAFSTRPTLPARRKSPEQGKCLIFWTQAHVGNLGTLAKFGRD